MPLLKNSPLEAATQITLVDGRLQGVIPDGWQQGRGAFGGLVLAMLIRAMEAHPAAGDRSLRSLTAELVGPIVAGAVTLEVDILRAGSGVTSLAARALQSGEVQAHAVGVLGKKRADDIDWVDLAAPPLPPWRDVPPLEIAPPFAPVFTQHIEIRPTGPLPFSGEGPRAAGWVRPRVAPARYDAALLAAMADAWWPAAFGRFAAPRPIATIAYTLQILGSATGLPVDAPLHHAGHAVAARDGYIVELRELRGSDGRLLALNQQTIAVIR